MNAGKKRSTEKKTRSAGTKSVLESQNVRVLLATLFLLVFVGICLVVLVLLRKNYRSDYQYAVSRPVPAVQSEPFSSYEDFHALIDMELLSASDSRGWKTLPAEKGIQRVQMFGDYPEQQLKTLSARISGMPSAAYLDLLPGKGLAHLYWQDQLRLELRYRLPITTSNSYPKIAIIMDDMGRRISTFEQLLQIDLQVTPAILPESANATRAARLLQKSDREYMIHLPMQPKQYPQVSPGPNALLLGQSDEQTRQLLRGYFERVPGAIGGNNHMGSRYTEDSGSMRIVLDELQRNGFFFIDSKTIASSVAFAEARKMGVPTAKRDIFLDNEEDIPYIRKQIRKMVRIAVARGDLIAICHPYPQTLEAFRLELEWLKQQPVEFVASSKIVKEY